MAFLQKLKRQVIGQDDFIEAVYLGWLRSVRDKACLSEVIFVTGPHGIGKLFTLGVIRALLEADGFSCPMTTIRGEEIQSTADLRTELGERANAGPGILAIENFDMLAHENRSALLDWLSGNPTDMGLLGPVKFRGLVVLIAHIGTASGFASRRQIGPSESELGYIIDEFDLCFIADYGFAANNRSPDSRFILWRELSPPNRIRALRQCLRQALVDDGIYLTPKIAERTGVAFITLHHPTFAQMGEATRRALEDGPAAEVSRRLRARLTFSPAYHNAILKQAWGLGGEEAFLRGYRTLAKNCLAETSQTVRSFIQRNENNPHIAETHWRLDKDSERGPIFAEIPS